MAHELPVVLVDLAVRYAVRAAAVFIDDVAGADILIVVKVLRHIFVVLVDAQHFDHVEGTDGLPDLEGMVAARGDDLVIVQQTGQFVPDKGNVEIAPPPEILLAGISSYAQLQAPVVHGADVHQVGRVARGSHHRLVVEQVAGVFVEEIHPQAQGALPEGEVQAEVGLGGLFPGKVVVAFAAEAESVLSVIVEPACRQFLPGIRADAREVARGAYAGASLEGGAPLSFK